MCLTTDNPTIKVAEKDIVCYKRLEFPTSSFMQRIFKPSSVIPYSIIWGKHYYIRRFLQPTVELVPHEVEYTNGEKIYRVHAGYHTHISPSHCNAKMIIPKGAKYIEGWNNDDKEVLDYVSETIVFVKRLDK